MKQAILNFMLSLTSENIMNKKYALIIRETSSQLKQYWLLRGSTEQTIYPVI